MQYSYLFGTSLFLPVWLAFFLWRKDLRREMLAASIKIGLLGIIAEFIWYTKDWVHPTTITHTVVGVEDFILGFSTGGIATVLYKIVFRKDDYKNIDYKDWWLLKMPVLFAVLIMDVLFRIFDVFSYYANLAGFGLLLIIFLIIRKDLIKEAVMGGLLLSVLTIPVYWAIFKVFPGFIAYYWNTQEISGYLFLGIPYEDLVWWFFAGAIISITHDYFNGLRIRSMRAQG